MCDYLCFVKKVKLLHGINSIMEFFLANKQVCKPTISNDIEHGWLANQTSIYFKLFLIELDLFVYCELVNLEIYVYSSGKMNQNDFGFRDSRHG